MTLTALPPTPLEPLCFVDGVRALHTLIDELQTVTLGVGDTKCLAEVDRARTRLDSLRLRLMSAAEAGDVAADAGLASTADWVSRQTRATRQESAQEAALARALEGALNGPATDGDAPLSATRTGLDRGVLSAAHAKVIADALRRLPVGVTAEQRAQCEARLVADARRFDPAQLRRVARRVLAEIEPDPVVVDAHENAEQVAEEDAAYDAARLSFHDNGDGTVTGRFVLPGLQADVLRKVVDAMTAPRRTARGDGGPRLAPDHARGLAFGELLEHLPVDHLHGPAATQVTVVMDVELLRDHLRTAGLDTDRPISAGEARRLACNSRLTPVVVGRALSGASLVLDMGRTSRLFSGAQRRAVHALHTHCAARGCSRPIAWCELHHRTPWSYGGRTDLAEAVPLCGWHHRRIHDHRYLHDWQTDGTVTVRSRT